MQVRISFDDDKEQEVEVEENDTVLGLKHRLHDKLSLQPSAQELEFDGLINTPKSWEIILREVFVISVHVVKQDKDGKPDPQGNHHWILEGDAFCKLWPGVYTYESRTLQRVE
ncbi:hypothetical protein OIU76_029034 [Salix suchowensis]|uniref:Ubiquitin-like domain-containing protein n=1 Tax=Salix suchowensis TaxID=1278906 RepID=A0ABQ9CF18_9ROSI|nr:hypothetical protein OIU76_029034 [Salix suchowensis]KAJ6367538.1 hypothetical protein OIU78_000157 [Salix suchowensis]KAJ6397060.1 hypothetical protein OIU77_021990 [Salix suchowensis]